MIVPITREFDWKLFFVWLLLVVMGIVAIFSASTFKVDSEIVRADFWLRQIVFAIISIFVMYMIMRTPATVIDIFVYPGYIIVIFLLILVLYMPQINNTNRWIEVAGVRFQPSELAKIILILVNARILSKDNKSIVQMMLKPALIIALPFALILNQPDLGTGIVLFVSYFVMLIQAGFPILTIFLFSTPFISMLTSFYIPSFIVFAALLIFFLYKKRFSVPIIIFILIINSFFLFTTPVIWGSLKPYQQGRILNFIDPSRDPLNTGYQVIQAKIAVGSGRLFGKGFLEGTQKNMNFLPEHHTDFIFSVVAEEFGFVGSLVLILAFLFFFLRIIKNISRSEIKERRIAMAGILGFLCFQVITNIGMNIGLMPTTGIPLPFISYGGSNLLINSIAVALVLKYSQEKDS